MQGKQNKVNIKKSKLFVNQLERKDSSSPTYYQVPKGNIKNFRNMHPTNSTPNYVIVQSHGNRMGTLRYEGIRILYE